MCDLLDEYVNKGIEKGLSQGLSQGISQGIQEGIRALVSTCKDFGASFEETKAKLKEKFSLEDAEAQRDMRLYW